jgi:hypothetical protein
MLHSVDYAHISNLGDYLADHKHWVYYPNNKQPANPNLRTLDQYARVKQGVLEFTRHRKEPDHHSRPRIELVPVFARVPKRRPVHIQYVVQPYKHDDTFRSIIFQCMDHENRQAGQKGSPAVPSVQLEVRYGKLLVRWSVIDDGNYVRTHIHEVARINWDNPKWYTFDFYCVFSHIESEASVHVFMDGKHVWERNVVNASETGGDLQLQYGIYGPKGTEMKTRVRSLYWEMIDQLVNTQDKYDMHITPVPDTSSEDDEGSDDEDTYHWRNIHLRTGTYEMILKKQ